MSSYYNNAPRIFTPSSLKTNKSFLPVESFASDPVPDTEPPPDVLNTCHRSRAIYLQHTHPYTYSMLRKAEAAKAEAAKAEAGTTPSPLPGRVYP